MYSFFVYGHENTLGLHKNTIEFTKESELSKRGDCIVGVRADFDPAILKEIVGSSDLLTIRIEAGGYSDKILCDANPEFSDEHEIVIRKTDFSSNRTFGIHADKAACDINRNIIEYLKDPNNKAKVTIK